MCTFSCLTLCIISVLVFIKECIHVHKTLKNKDIQDFDIRSQIQRIIILLLTFIVSCYMYRPLILEKI